MGRLRGRERDARRSGLQDVRSSVGRGADASVLTRDAGSLRGSAVLAAARRTLRGDRAGPSRLRELGRSGVARFDQRSCLFLCRLHRGARASRRAFGRALDRRLDRITARGAQLRAPAQSFARELGRLLFVNGELARRFVEEEADPERFSFNFKNSVTAAKLTWQPRLCDPQLSKWLHRITVPTFILWGESDRVIPPQYAEALHAAIAGSTVKILPECGHVPAVERPDEFVGAISGFIEKVAS